MSTAPVRQLRPKSKALNQSLLTPSLDFWMVGGLSLLVWHLSWTLLDHKNPASGTRWFVFYLAYLVNFPHFLMSYQLLYWDFKHHIFNKWRYFWAAILVPGLLIFGLMATASTQDPQTMGVWANVMYFFVGWHYIKQIFGGVIVHQAVQKQFYNKWEKLSLKANLFSIWGLAWFNSNLGMRELQYYGFPYTTLELPSVFKTGSLVAVGLTFALVAYQHVQRYIRTGQTPTLPALTCFGSIYAWYIPVLFHPAFFHIIPFFHSLQYMLFVFAFRQNKVESQLDAAGAKGPQRRRKFLKWHFGYLLIPFITGAIAFEWLPKYLDSLHIAGTQALGAQFFLFCSSIFLNIHHYFIDNVLWRGDEPEIRRFLFKDKRTTPATPSNVEKIDSQSHRETA